MDDRGGAVGVVSAIRDLSDRKATELRLTKAASTDPLTGLLNRRAFTEALEAEWQRVRERGGACSVAMIDIDHFKSINDRFGHAVGDTVIRTVAEIAKTSLRDADVIGRLGGEEFGIVLRDTELEVAAAVAERIRGAIALVILRPETGVSVSTTVSVGVAPLLASQSPGTALRQADKALYNAKAAGRNCLRLVG
jgi:diguanylate cyclase (GGDEF)-like protein